MKGDGPNGGELLLTEKEKVPQQKVSTQNPVLQSTMIATKKTDEYNQSNQKIINNFSFKVLTGGDPSNSAVTTIN